MKRIIDLSGLDAWQRLVLAGLVLTIAVLALAKVASAHDTGKYVAASYVNDELLDSDWAFDNEVVDASCTGSRPFKTDGAGQVTSKHFVCRMETEHTGWDWKLRKMGTCVLTARVHVLYNGNTLISTQTDSCKP